MEEIVPLAPYEEDLLYRKLGAKLQCAKRRDPGYKRRPGEVDPLVEAKRLYRKLAVRKLRRRNGIKVFDLDEEVKNFMQSSGWKKLEQQATDPLSKSSDRVLDRYQVRNTRKCHDTRGFTLTYLEH